MSSSPLNYSTSLVLAACEKQSDFMSNLIRICLGSLQLLCGGIPSSTLQVTLVHEVLTGLAQAKEEDLLQECIQVHGIRDILIMSSPDNLKETGQKH